jgi:hypothetical protein
MKKATSGIVPLAEDSDFRELVLSKSKELMINNFEAIFDLSSTGFRLIEKEAIWHIHLLDSTLTNKFNLRAR